jgi:probable HAF family extracellular repeat protein
LINALSRWRLGTAATVLPPSDHFKSGQRLSLQTGKVSPNFLSADFAVLEGSWRPQKAVDHVTRVEVVSRDNPRRVDAAVATPNPVNNLCGQLQLGVGVPTVDPFFWENDRMIDVGTLGGVCGYATGLNNQGQVIGDSNLAGDVFYHGFRWDKKKHKLQDLATLGGSYSGTSGISEAGDAVGWANLAGDRAFHAVTWRSGKRKPTDLGVLTGYPSSFAYAVNSKGQITGGLTNTAGACPPSHSAAFLWENGDMVDLNTLVPPHPGIQLTGCEAYINDRGEIVTLGILSDGDTHAFLLIPKKRQ